MAEIMLADLLAWEPRLRAAKPPATGTYPGGQPANAALEREVTWAVAARATTPMLPPLRGGELVLLPHRILAESGVTVVPLLRELVGHGVAAVLLESEAVPPGRSPLPILVLPVGPIGPDLEGELNRLLTQRRGELYRIGTEVGRLLVGLTAGDADIARLLHAAAELTGIASVVHDARGSSLASSGSGGGGSPEQRVNLPLAGGESLVLGPVSSEQRALARLVGERIAVGVEAMLERASRDRPRGPARAAALGAFLAGSGAGPVAARVGALGLTAEGLFRVALAAPGFGFNEIERTLAPLGTVIDAASLDGANAVVIEMRGPRLPHWRHPAEPVGARATPADRWLALSGAVTGAVALPDAARQARFVAALLASGALRGPTVRFDSVQEMGAFRLLYGLWGSPDLMVFAAEALGELPERDRRQTLRETLLVYLTAGGSHVDAAAHLHIHRNTLAYRLKQIATYTGQDLTNPATWLTLHLALLVESLPPLPGPEVRSHE